MKRTARAVPLVAALGMLGGLALSGVAVGQSSEPSGSDSAEPITFIIGLTNNIITVNPLKALEAPEYELLAMQYDLLFNFSKEDMSAVPALATEIPTKENGGLSEDGLTYTINIRDDAVWSDGEPLTARDIAFTYNLVLDQGWSNFTNYLPFTDSIKAKDDTTLVWKTTKPSIAPLIPPWIYILPEHIWGGMSKDEIKKFENFDPDTGTPVTSGPFHMVEWNKDEDWTLESNDNYWGGTPTIDRVIVKRYTNPEAMVSDLKQGVIDFAETVPVDLFQTLQDTPGIGTNVGGSFSFSQFSFNQCYEQKSCDKSTGHPALKDETVREAMAMAIDKAGLVDRILGGYGTVGSTIVVPTVPFWHLDPDPAIPFDIPGANELLDGAGYDDTDGDGIRNMPGGGENLDFRFIVRTESPEQIQAGKLIAGWFKQIGIGTQTQAVTDSKLIDSWLASDYDVYIWGWGPDPDPDFILSSFTTGQCGVWSDTCYSNPEYDQLYADQQTSTSPDDRQLIVKQMQQILYDDIPEVVLWYDNDLQAYNSDRWTNFSYQPTPGSDGEGGYILFQFGNYSYISIEPVAGSGAGTASGNSGIPAWVWGAIALAIVLVVGGVMFARSRGSDEDKA